MKKELIIKDKIILYDLNYKRVKNINLRIHPDGKVSVSARKNTPQIVIDDFLVSKGDFILNALERFKKAREVSPKQYFKEEDIRDVIIDICKKVYPYYEEKGIIFPCIKFRKMVSRWGSCHTIKGVLTFNTNLVYAPIECIEYVVYHEFTHFLEANHSSSFYDELSIVCPDWKERRRKLKEIVLQ